MEKAPLWNQTGIVARLGRRASEPGAPLNVPLDPRLQLHPRGTGRDYSRNDGTPTWEALEEVVGGLEAARPWRSPPAWPPSPPCLTSSRLVPLWCYPTTAIKGVAGLVAAGAEGGRWSVQRVAVDDTDGWIRCCSGADLIWLESPSNPLLTVADLEAICAAPRKPGAIVAVDNTFATPLNQQPLDLGATVSVQSATKFLGGHSDLLAGVATTRDEALWHALRKSRALTGATPGILEAFLAVRGARTLALRLQRAHSRLQSG
jgi:cystathionine gamma-synthase